MSQQPSYARAKKSLGQNFLVDPNLQRKIVRALEVGPGDEVLEIGPGQGALTSHLVEKAGRVVAVELDDDLASILVSPYVDEPSVELVHGDVTKTSLLVEHLELCLCCDTAILVRRFRGKYLVSGLCDCLGETRS